MLTCIHSLPGYSTFGCATVTLLCCIPPGTPRHTLLRALILNMVCCPNKEIYDSLPSLLDRLSLPTATPQPQTALIILDEGSRSDLIARKSLLCNIPFILATDLDSGDLVTSLLPVRPRTILPFDTDPLLLVTYVAKRIEYDLDHCGMTEKGEGGHGRLRRKAR